MNTTRPTTPKIARHECRACVGVGTKNGVTCPACKGTGATFGHRADRFDCPHCNGNGIDPLDRRRSCNACNGTGTNF